MESSKALTKVTAAAVTLLVILIVAASPVLSSQPSLPTTIYGRVSYANNTPAEGFIVEALWTDNYGQYKSSITETLTLEKAAKLGDPGLVGHYFFNQGYIMAQEGSEITINAEGGVNAEKVTALPGGEGIPAPLLLVPDVTDKTPPGISGVSVSNIEGGGGVTFSTNELSTSAVRYGTQAPVTTAANNTLATSHLVRLTDLATYSSYVFEVIATDASGNTITDNNNGQYYRFQTGGQTDSGTGTGTGPTASKPTPNKPGTKQSSETSSGEQEADGKGTPDEFEATPNILPTSVYGKVADAERKAVEDADVTAEWTDNEGQIHRLKTETLNSKEARKLGNPDLAGYYFFRQNLTLPYGAEVNITSEEADDYEARANANPGGSSQAVVTKKAASLLAAKRPKTVQAKQEDDKPKAGLLQKLPAAGKTALNFALAAAVLIVAGLAAASLRHYAAVKQRASAGKELGKAVKNLLGKSVKDVLTREIVSIDCSETVEKAAWLMLEKEKGAVIAVEGQTPLGWVTEKTVTEEFLLKQIGLTTELRKAAILKPVLLSADKTLADAYKQMEKSNQKKAVVMSGGKMMGVVTIADIAAELQRFSNKYFLESQSIPDVSSIMERKVVKASRNSTLREIRQAMSRNNTDYVIVEGEKPEEQKAMITERDLLEEIAVNPKKAADAKAAVAAKLLVQTIPQYVNLFEANNVMLSERFRRLPVISQGQVVGVVTQDETVGRLLAYLQRVFSAIRLRSAWVRKS